jgi:hypothetical protein
LAALPLEADEIGPFPRLQSALASANPPGARWINHRHRDSLAQCQTWPAHRIGDGNIHAQTRTCKASASL